MSSSSSPEPGLSFGDWVRGRLFDQRTVLVSGELDATLATAAAAELMTLDAEGDELVSIHLDCSDGSLEAAFTLMDVVDLVGVPVHVVAVGQVVGPAVGILAVADRRLALPHAQLQLREPRSSYRGHADDVVGWAEQFQRQLGRFVARLARAVGRDEVEVAHDLQRGLHLDPEQATAYGLVDEVVTGRAEVRRLPGRGFGFQA
jgi:ATP-dependent Clp protease protease subunit